MATYQKLAGYNPATGANDTGLAIRSTLVDWQRFGLGKKKIDDYCFVNPLQTNLAKLAVHYYGGLRLGIGLPISAQRQKIWDVPIGGAVGDGAMASWGYHEVPILKYNSDTATCVTWGGLKEMTWRFISTYSDEAWAVLMPDWFANGVAPNGLKYAILKGYLSRVGTG